MSAKIGYISIEHYKTDKLRVCEAPRHKGLMLPAFAVMAIEYEQQGEMVNEVQMICHQCWQHFDLEMGSPNWNMMEWENEDRSKDGKGIADTQ